MHVPAQQGIPANIFELKRPLQMWKKVYMRQIDI